MTLIQVKKIVFSAIMAIVAVMCFLPFYMMIIMGTYDTPNLYTNLNVLPGDLWLYNPVYIFKSGFLLYYRNSFTVSSLVTILSITFSMAAGYAFAKYRFIGNKQLFIFVMLTMMIPYQISLVGFLIQMRAFGWIGTLLPLILPPTASAFGVFWMRQYAISFVPTEILESARIDGSNEFRTFFTIVIPMSRAAMFTLGILAFSGSWNSYLVPLVVISNDNLNTITLAVSKLSSMFFNDYAKQICALTIGTIPILCIFATGSKYFIRGLSAGAIKG